MNNLKKLLLIGAGLFTAGQLLKPRFDKFGKLRKLMQTDFAYKGLFDNKEIPENSILSFEKAIEKDKGIFTNLSLTSDNVPILIDKKKVEKMIGISVEIEALSYAEIREFNLLKTDCKILTLAELLDLVKNKVPIYIRVENMKKHSAGTVITAIGDTLNGHDTEVLFDTSDERLLHLRMIKRPDLIFGQILFRNPDKGLINSDIFKNFMRYNLLNNAFTSPDFISCEYSSRHSIALSACRGIYGVPVFYFGINSKDRYEDACDDGVGIIGNMI